MRTQERTMRKVLTALAFATLGILGLALTTEAGSSGGLARLLNGHIFVGNLSAVATDVAMTGDCQISNTGVTTVGSVANASLANGHVFVGNLSGKATDVAMSGDVTIASGGSTTVGVVTHATLTSGHMLVGDGLSKAADVAMSGDSTLATGGAVTVTQARAGKVTFASNGAIGWASGLGAITEINGPQDQDLDITALAQKSVNLYGGVQAIGTAAGGGIFLRPADGGTTGGAGGNFLCVLGTAQAGNTAGGTAVFFLGGASGSGTPGYFDVRARDGTVLLHAADDYGLTLAGLRGAYQTQGVVNGFTYTIPVTTITDFVDASALGAAQSATIQLPSAVTYAGRIIGIKIVQTGNATASVVISALAGNVEGGASLSIVPNVRTGDLFQSDGTDWWAIDKF